MAILLPCLLLLSSTGRVELLPQGQRPIPARLAASTAVPQSDLSYSLSDINAGHIISSALSESYPDVIEGPFWQDDDWVLLVRGKKFYWAAGRLLDAKAKAESDYLKRYSAYRFYDYPEELPTEPGGGPRSNRYFLNEPLWQGLRPLGRRGLRSRNPEFFHSLLDVWQRSDMIDKYLIELRFLGYVVKVHKMLVPTLRRVEAVLQQERQNDLELDRFLKNLRSTSGFVWRNIAGTSTLSMHSYGIAVDLIPRRWDGDPYWLWVQRKGLEWQNYPYEKRWQLPEIVIKTFEEEGFIWGGKWRRFDTMHFEYHPEIRRLKPYFRSLFGSAN